MVIFDSHFHSIIKMKNTILFLLMLSFSSTKGQDNYYRYDLQPLGDTICDKGSVKLAVEVFASKDESMMSLINSNLIEEKNQSLNWYNDEIGGVCIGKGISFNCPEISSSKTFYASLNCSGGLSVFSEDFKKVDGEGLVFDLYTPILLNSVEVYSSMQGKISVVIKKSDGTQITNQFFTVTPGVNKLNLNCNLPTGWGFIIEAFGLTPNIQLSTIKYASWPIILGTFGEIIEGTENKRKYNYFFNWDISTRRVPVMATIIKSTKNITTKNECNNYLWPLKNETYNKSGDYSEVKGCHTETLKLTITPTSKKTEVKSACESYVWSADGKKYQTSGTYTTTSNCLTQELVLTIESHKTNVSKQSAIDSYTWAVNNKIYKVSGTYTEEVGCVTEKLDLTVTYSVKAIAEKNNNPEVKIGEQIWMSKNLNVSTFRNGDPIPEAKTEDDWENAWRDKQPAWCYIERDGSLKRTAYFGKLYNWYAVNDPRGLAPLGWHIPTDDEWITFHLSLGGGGGFVRSPGNIWFDLNTEQIKSMPRKYTEVTYVELGGYNEINWISCSKCDYFTEEQRKHTPCNVCRNEKGWYKKGKYIPLTKKKVEEIIDVGWDGNNSSSFNALPGGFIDHNYKNGLGSETGWWTSTEYDTNDYWEKGKHAYTRKVSDGLDSKTFFKYHAFKGHGYYVRCVKNDDSEGEWDVNEEFKAENTDCDWKPSEGMNFECNTGCGFKIDDKKGLDGIESGDIFRAYVNSQFPEIAKKYELNIKGIKPLDYCNFKMKQAWEHVYDSNDFPGLIGNTIGKIYIDGLKPENIKMNCNPWELENYFINDYLTEEERNNAAWEMIISYNNEFDMVLDSKYLKQCDTSIDNDLIWAEIIKSKDLYKHPVIKFIANKKVYGEKWYDYWRKSQK